MAKKIERSPAAVALAKALLEDGNIKSAEDVNDVLREVCGGWKKIYPTLPKPST